MENTSRALMMAAGVLIGVFILSLLVVFFSNLRALRENESVSLSVDQVTEFNKQFDSYDRIIYGSELLSLANKIDDYNKREADTESYQPIVLEVKINQNIDDSYFKTGNYKIGRINGTMKNEIQQELDKIELELNEIGSVTVNSDTISIISRRIKQLATMRDADIVSNLGINVSKTISVTTTKNGKKEMTVRQAKDRYNSLKSLLTQVKSKQFRNNGFEFDKNNGRLVKMNYVNI